MTRHLVHIADDWLRSGVAIHMADRNEREMVLYDFGGVTLRTVPTDSPLEDDHQPLYLSTEAARALYEALADHFGHSGHDTRALRRDYDAERKRVDLFIEHALRSQP